MNIAVVDDQKEFIEINIDKLKQMNRDDLKIYSYLSVCAMEEEHTVFDLILLDIDMPDVDGIQYAKKHKNLNVVFLTSMGNRIKEAFGTNVYGFIEKSENQTEFNHVLFPIIEEIYNNETICLKVDGETMALKKRNIVYIQYIAYKTIALVYESQSYIVKGYTLKNAIPQLGDRFIFINRETIVNKQAILKMIGYTLYLRGIKTSFTVSCRRMAEIKRSINKEI